MKQSLFTKNNFISSKGSATVMALMFLLFFVVAGAGWAAMMAKEEGTAAGDTNAQQAWYAAEAGMKRAQIELVNKNTGNGWNWLSESVTIPDNKFVALISGETSTDDNVPRYGVYVAYPYGNATQTILATTKTMSTTDGMYYVITSIGKYKGSTRTITKKFKINITNG